MMYLIHAAHSGEAVNSAALTDLEIKSHVDYRASYQVGFNFLKKTHQQSMASRGAGLREFFGNNTDAVFPPEDSSVPANSRDTKDLKSAFERIYEVAKRGPREEAKEAFDFLLKLKKVPHCIGLSAFSVTDWAVFCEERNSLEEVFEKTADFLTMFNTQKRQEILSFLCAYYHANHTTVTMQPDELERHRINLGNQIKKYLTDQLGFQKNLSVYTLQQFLLPTLGIFFVGFWSIMMFSYYDDPVKRIAFGISGAVSGMLSAFFKWWLDQTRCFTEQATKWELLISENELQRQADFLAAFFTILKYQARIDGTFLWQNCINQAIQEQYGIILRLRQGLPSWMPFHSTMKEVEPLEKIVLQNVRSNLRIQ